MQASNSSLPTPSSFACEIWQWVQAQKSTFTIKELSNHEKGKLLLPIFGTLHVQLLLPLLDESAQRVLTQKMQYQIATMQEIISCHLANLRGNRPLQLPEKSLYQSRTVYDYPPLERYMLLQIRQSLALSPCPISEARLFKLHRIPHYPLEESSMNAYLNGLDDKNWQTIRLLLSWCGETTPDQTKLTLTPQQWMEILMTALRLEAWPGVSYCEAIFRWGNDGGQGSAQYQLMTKFKELCLFYSLLERKSAKKLANGPIIFSRDQNLVLAKKDTLQTYIARFSQAVMVASILKTVGTKLHNLNVDAFSSFFLSHYEHVFCNERIRPHLLYYIETISRGYQSKKTVDVAGRRELFRENIKFLKRLFTKETVENGKIIKAFPRENKTAYSFLYGVALFYHTVHLAPPVLTLEPSWFQEIVDLSCDDKDILFAAWKDFTPVQNESTLKTLNLPHLLSRFGKTPLHKVQILTEVIADSCDLRPPGAKLSLQTHITFIQKVEELTHLKVEPITGYFLLTSLPLNQGIFRYLEQLKELQDGLKTTAKDQSLFPQSELTRQIEEMTLVDLPVALTPREIKTDTLSISSKLMGEITTLIDYCLMPHDLNKRYCRFLILAQTNAPKEEDDLKYWHWARLHNGALIELSPGLRAMRCEVRLNDTEENHLELSILWIHSLQTLVTRRVKVVLSSRVARLFNQSALQLPILAAKLCTGSQPEDLDLKALPTELISFCSLLKKEMTLAVTDESDPVIKFNEQERCFYLTSLNLYLPLNAFQVKLSAYSEIFERLIPLLKTICHGEKPKAFTALLWKENKPYEADVDFLFEHKQEKCIGEGEDEVKVFTKDFYTITLRLSEMPQVQFCITYLELPTPNLIAWQLALLKEQFFQLKLLS
jgi:hypothetical protein